MTVTVTTVSGWTLYLLVFSEDGASVWNGSAFVVATDANQNGSAIPMTEAAGVYTAPFPPEITATGTHPYTIYRLLGAAADVAVDTRITYPSSSNSVTIVGTTPTPETPPQSASGSGFGVGSRLRQYWRRMPDRRNVTYYRRTLVGPPSLFTNFPAYDLWHRRYVNATHPGNPGVYVVYQADLYLPKETNPTIATTAPPLPGDQIQDAPATRIPRTGRLWTINTVAEAGAEGAWQLGCVFPAIVAAVGIPIKVQRPVINQTPSGLRISDSWTDLTSQTAWIQDYDGTAGDHLGKRQIPNTATLYLSTQIAVSEAQDTVYDVTNDVRYTIKKCRPALDFLTLQELDVERLF